MRLGHFSQSTLPKAINRLQMEHAAPPMHFSLSGETVSGSTTTLVAPGGFCEDTIT
jgi:hypothetical protein